MGLDEFIGVILKWKWLVLPIVILVTGYAMYTSTGSQINYRSEVMVIPGLPEIVSSGIEGSYATGSEKISATFSEVVFTEPVMEKAVEKSGLDISPAALRGRVSVETTKDTPIFRIIATGEDTETAQQIANSVAESLIEYLQQNSKESLEVNRRVISDELADVEAQLASANSTGTDSAGQPVDQGKIKGLQSMRSQLLEDYQQLFTGRLASADIQVEKTAASSQVVGTSAMTRVLLAVVISLVTAVILAFVAEGISKALRQRNTQAQGE